MSIFREGLEKKHEQYQDNIGETPIEIQNFLDAINAKKAREKQYRDIGRKLVYDHPVHRLKTWPEYFEAIVSGYKTFEIRKNDRDFKVQDILILREFDSKKQLFSGRETKMQITYILKDSEWLPCGFVAMSIKKYEEEE